MSRCLISSLYTVVQTSFGKTEDMNSITAAFLVSTVLAFQYEAAEGWLFRNLRKTTATTTASLTTLPPTTTPVQGCEHNGRPYRHGESFGEGYDPSSNWCYGMYCDSEGNIVAWDNFNCYPTTSAPKTTTPNRIPTTRPTRIPTTTPTSIPTITQIRISTTTPTRKRTTTPPLATVSTPIPGHLARVASRSLRGLDKLISNILKNILPRNN